MTHPKRSDVVPCPQIMSREAFTSPIDGKTIRNSKDLAAHEREYDVVQVGDEVERKRNKAWSEDGWTKGKDGALRPEKVADSS